MRTQGAFEVAERIEQSRKHRTGRAWGQTLAQTTAAPKRFLLFYMPHGAPPEHFRPQVMENDPTAFSLDMSVGDSGSAMGAA